MVEDNRQPLQLTFRVREGGGEVVEDKTTPSDLRFEQGNARVEAMSFLLPIHSEALPIRF